MKRSKGKATASGAAAFGSKPAFGSAFGPSSGRASSLSYLTEPPSLSEISDPNIVVSIKNVLKKDATTKVKGLEDLVAFAQSHPPETGGDVQDALLDVWTQIYPRTSIDNSRRVRELSHILQRELIKSTRKRMEKRISKVVGPWLAGSFDRDHSVARAARDGISTVLTSPEKVRAFWKKCQSQILEFATDAIQETKDTLSDERSTTEDDAEAKLSRVVVASLSLVLSLLVQVDGAAVEELSATYEDFFSQEGVWESFVSKDTSARKAAYHLMFVCLDRRLPYVEAPKIRLALVSGGLRAKQTGSALEYVRALTKLTDVQPEIWTPSAKQKKAPLTMLQSFIAKGSQGSPPRFWEHLDQLLCLLPPDALSLDTFSGLVSSIKSGIMNREEPITNTSYSWKCYVDASKRALAVLPTDDRLSFAEAHLFPLFTELLSTESTNSRASPRGVNAMAVYAELYVAIVRASPQLAAVSAEKWKSLSDTLCSKIQASSDGESESSNESQSKLVEQGRRWFSVVGQIHDRTLDKDVPDHLTGPSVKILSQVIRDLESQTARVSGSAGIIEFALSNCSYLFDSEIGSTLVAFLEGIASKDVLATYDPISSNAILSCLRLLGPALKFNPTFEKLWSLWVDTLVEMPANASRDSILASLLSLTELSPLSRKNDRLQDQIISETLARLQEQGDSWELLKTALASNSLSQPSCETLARAMVDALGQDSSNLSNVLKALELFAVDKKNVLLQDESIHTALLARSLSLSEISDAGVSSQAASLRALLTNTTGDGVAPAVKVIQTNLEHAGPQSLEIDTLVQQAVETMKLGAPLEAILPSTNVWLGQLAPFLSRPLNPSLTITNSLGGAAALAQPSTEQTKAGSPRDRRGLSVPARMALYTCRLLAEDTSLVTLPPQFHVELLYLFCLTVQLASDQITTLEEGWLWLSLENPQASSEAEELVSILRAFINERADKTTWWAASDDDPVGTAMRGLVELLIKQSTEPTTQALYSARALGEILQVVAENHGLPSKLEADLFKTEILKATPTTSLLCASLLTAFGETLQASKAVNNLCNRLVSDAAAATPDGDKTSMTLVLLTLTTAVYPSGELPVANNRIVFAVRQMTSWLEEPSDLGPSLRAEVCRCLARLMPNMKDVYGSYWESAIGFCTWLWSHTAEGAETLEESLPSIHASLKLMKTLEGIPEPNDDLQEALQDAKGSKAQALVELLQLPRGATTSLPLQIVDGMLSREVQKVDVRRITDLSEIYALVASESRDVQTATFDLLHRAIPARQEQLSIDVLLDKSDARLPDELLSLLLDAPTLEKYPDEILAQFPSSIRGYLLSWMLVFDAFSASSFKIRGDLADNLKTGEYVAPLLDFMFDVLGHSAAQPIRLDKEGFGSQQITKYDMNLASSEPEETDMQWLLVHLFYMVLKFTPGLFRAWYRDCRSKQTKVAVESWTTKYFSPIIVAETLDDVQAWANNQDSNGDDEQDLLIKVSRPAREVIAGYEVDESEAQIAIRISQSYPIDGVSVVGLKRVAVDEKKWQSWIKTTQGIITFTNGNVIDGLQAFRRNFVGALKGQSECAICYSIIAADKRMPDKRCTTCKNFFHRSCLYKWFQSSNQNTCPLCRNPIDYLGSDTQKRRQ